MRHRAWLGALGVISVMAASAAQAACVVAEIAKLPVTMEGMSPLITAKINGTDTRLIADSGAFWSTLSPSAAVQFKLKATRTIGMRGVGGRTTASVARVSDFGLAGGTVHNVDFLIQGNEFAYGISGVLGQNVWAAFDVEYDLANGLIRLMRPVNCGKEQPLAYWVSGSAQPPSMVEISPTKADLHTVGEAQINGTKIRAYFDTGASTSLLNLAAATRAGIKPTDPGARPGGVQHGFGGSYAETWIVPVTDFKIGGEEIRNTHLRIGGANNDYDMLVGADFFLSHRVYVSNQQHRLYFTYNGGQVFNLTTTPIRVAATASDAGLEADTQPKSPTADNGADDSVAVVSDVPPDAVPASVTTTDAPQQAATASQLGMALAARREFTQALAELDRACQLAPSEPAYRVQRARVHLELQQLELALKDLDAALILRPEALDALLARAELRINQHENQAARADLDAAAKASTAQSDERFTIAMLYKRIDELELAAAQPDQWITVHPQELKRAAAYTQRCWDRALLGQDLRKALDDCNQALRAAPESAGAYDGRGLIRLRTGEYKPSINDYDTALKLQPKIAWCLYGRGLDRLYLGQTTQGEADIAAAVELVADIATRAAKFGIAPPTSASGSR